MKCKQEPFKQTRLVLVLVLIIMQVSTPPLASVVQHLCRLHWEPIHATPQQPIALPIVAKTRTTPYYWGSVGRAVLQLQVRDWLTGGLALEVGGRTLEETLPDEGLTEE